MPSSSVILDWIAKKFSKNTPKMIVATGVAGWILSSAAQIVGVLMNPKISDKEKGFLLPQEILDAAVNIGLFFIFTRTAQKTVAKMFSTGKLAPKSLRVYMNKHFPEKVGKVDFNLDDALKNNPEMLDKYWACKNFGTAVATVGAGVIASNVLTPIIRNNKASKAQKNFIDYTNANPVYTNYSSGMKV